MADRRPLQFDGIGEIMPEVRRLLDGHENAGRWSLSQILTHLARAVALTAEAPPSTVGSAGPSREAAVRKRRLLSSGRFPEGVEMPTPAIDPGPADADPRLAAEALDAAIGRFLATADPRPPHPILGPMTRDDWERFHCIHCAHHLSFAIPRPSA